MATSVPPTRAHRRLDVETLRGTARVYVVDPNGAADGTLVLGHGAGKGTNTPDLDGLTALADDGWRVVLVDQPWVARGLREVRSTGLDLTDVPGQAVGPPGWYLSRPGFAWGGLGVAAVWLGGAMGIARTMRAAAQGREPDQIGLLLLGRVDAGLTAGAAVLTEAAHAVDQGLAQGEHAWARCVRTRQVVHDACESVLESAAHSLGPGPLAGDERHAARIADLQLYLRQHKAERDEAVVGRALVDGMPTPW